MPEPFDPKAMGDKALVNFLIHMDKLARHAQTIKPVKDNTTVLVAPNMPICRHMALYRYQLPADYWSALEEAKARDLI